eukprot:COSAG06_NODE_2914_length_6099_cov_4.555333_1_plen_315_part_10
MLCAQVNSALGRSLAPSVFDSAKFSVDVLDGVVCLLRLGHGPLRAIHDFHVLFKRAAGASARSDRAATPTKEAARLAKVARRQITAGLRKLWFFVVWCAEIGGVDGSCLDWLQLAASVAEQSQLLQTAATTGEELRAHIVSPKISTLQPAPGTGPGENDQAGDENDGQPQQQQQQQQQPIRISAAEVSVAEQEALQARQARQIKLAGSEASTGEGSDVNVGTQQQLTAGQLALPPGMPSPSQLVAKLWPTQQDNCRTDRTEPESPPSPEPQPEPSPELLTAATTATADQPLPTAAAAAASAPAAATGGGQQQQQQ